MKTIFDFGWKITKSRTENDMLSNEKKDRNIVFNNDIIILKVRHGYTYKDISFKKDEFIAIGEYLKTLDIENQK